MIQGKDEKGGGNGMACSDYKNVAQVQQEFKITYHEKNDFEQGWGQCLASCHMRVSRNDDTVIVAFHHERS